MRKPVKRDSAKITRSALRKRVHFNGGVSTEILLSWVKAATRLCTTAVGQQREINPDARAFPGFPISNIKSPGYEAWNGTSIRAERT